MRLAHLHLPKPISYKYSLRLQEALLEKHFLYNSYNLQASRSSTNANDALVSPFDSAPIQPAPTLLTFQSQPVYTVGRRHLKTNPLSQAQIDFLTAGTHSDGSDDRRNVNNTKLATFHSSPRGGLLTYHAPGQLTAYLVINLRTHGITPRCYIRMLENTVIRTCKRHGVPNTMTTTDPGVWISEQASNLASSNEGNMCTISNPSASAGRLRPTTRKICAIGVHVVRGVTSHGLGFNVYDAPITSSKVDQHTLPDSDRLGNDATQKEPGYLSWGFGRIVACGLDGKSVTWLQQEGAAVDTFPDTVAYTLAQEVCHGLTTMGRLNVEGVTPISEEEVLSGSTNSIREI